MILQDDFKVLFTRIFCKNYKEISKDWIQKFKIFRSQISRSSKSFSWKSQFWKRTHFIASSRVFLWPLHGLRTQRLSQILLKVFMRCRAQGAIIQTNKSPMWLQSKAISSTSLKTARVLNKLSLLVKKSAKKKGLIKSLSQPFLTLIFLRKRTIAESSMSRWLRIQRFKSCFRRLSLLVSMTRSRLLMSWRDSLFEVEYRIIFWIAWLQNSKNYKNWPQDGSQTKTNRRILKSSKTSLSSFSLRIRTGLCSRPRFDSTELARS